MSIHGDDLVLTIRKALADADIARTQSEVRMYPNAENDGWKNRDGRLEFDCIGREWFRAFRVTVEAIPVDDFRGEFGSDAWVVAEVVAEAKTPS
jgi:hypothetical protein